MSSTSAQDYKLFVGNMPGDVTAEEIQSVFAKFGTVHEVYTMGGTRSKSGQSSAFVRFGSHDECERAINEIHLKGKIRTGDAALLVVKYAKPQSARFDAIPPGACVRPGITSVLDSTLSTVANSSPSSSPLPSPSGGGQLSKVFVGGMPSYVDRDDLIAIFAPYGRVESVHLMNKNKSKSGQSCGFVNFYDTASSIAAIDALNARYTIQEDVAPITVRFADTSDLPTCPKRQKSVSIEQMAQEAAQSILERHHRMSERLRGQLLNLGERFIGFDKVVEAESVKTKRLEAEKNGILIDRVFEAEKLVYAEIRARTESNKQFQSEIELFCNTVLEKMQHRVSRRIEKLLAEIEMMDTRCVTLERGQQQFRGELPSKLQVDTAALVREMNGLKTKLQEDITVWRAREEAVIRKIDLTMKNLFVSIEKSNSNEAVTRVKADLQKVVAPASNEVIISEISRIRQEIQIEEETRKFADTEILNAITSYTAVLQKGLHQVVKTT